MSAQHRLSCPAFDGTHESYEDWRSRLTGDLSLRGWLEYMHASQREGVAGSQVTKELRELAELVILATSGEAFSVLRNREETHTDGHKALTALEEHFKPNNQTRSSI